MISISPGCGKNVDILDQADALGIVSNLPLLGLQGKPSQSSGISPLSKSMGEIFTLSSPPIRMGDEGTTTQQVKVLWVAPNVIKIFLHISHP
ncbi:uncharacterized protein OCT59_000252 [Rhizophagus irregularis]|uniref:uncharacterized protein n=1 Tax=Rhizophagus irregularis TaxID=588596 RepID=UPI0033269916|nr:hypothetical protein OCT59_000252 [Rhizophagus irregularis]